MTYDTENSANVPRSWPNTSTKAAGSSSKAGNGPNRSDDKQSGGKKYMTFVYADKVEFLGEAQRDGQKTELTRDQSYSQKDPTMITDSDVPF